MTAESEQPAQTIEVGKAPGLPAWPAGLSPVETIDGKACMAPDLTAVVHRRLLYLDAYPELCQVSIDMARAVDAAEYERKLRIARAEERQRIPPPIKQGWQAWEVGAVVGGVAIVAGVIGYGFGAMFGPRR